jgi:FlaA1/EpsC-like NDP-sugar epimerase
MLENNPIEGISNNVLGTKRIAEAASLCGVHSLVVVSTDKAVRPTNLMGATKRFAELVVQSIASTTPTMSTCMVRFGNVLGSSGSVVPTFREQISLGGPVTVTDPEVTRFFMTIPEASQLVLQAGAMAKNAEIFVLDMGEPVKIYDLARRMIELSGHRVLDASNPQGDIEILFTGLRPGEKMYEELSIAHKLKDTGHPKISKSDETKYDHCIATELAHKLEHALQDRNDALVVQLVCQAVPEYTPSKKLQDGFS